MQKFIGISTIVLALQALSVQANGLSCLPFTGELQQLASDSQCRIGSESEGKYFQDLTFLYKFGGAPEYVCFVGNLTGRLGSGRAIKGQSFSGLTLGLPGSLELSAASIITLKEDWAKGKTLGKLYTQDVIVEPFGNTREYLTVVDGTNLLSQGRGNFTIIGNALAGKVNLVGTLCVDAE